MKHINKGFTLIEAMLVMAVLTILLAVGVPNYQQFRRDHELIGAAYALYGDIQLARTEATKTNSSDIHIYIFNDSGSNWCYRITDRDTDTCDACNATCDINGDGLTRGNDQSNFASTTMVTTSGSVSTINIENRRTGLDPDGDHITFDLAGRQIQVELSPIGSTRVCTPSGTSLSGIESCT
ncbi:MAG: GspH/FimT family pseudopilin [Aeromonadaceae bacterium]